DSVGREQIPDAAPGRRRHALARDHRRGEHHVDCIRGRSRKQNGSRRQGIDGSHCNSFLRVKTLAVIARSDSEEAIHLSTRGAMDCFASLAMTGKTTEKNVREETRSCKAPAKFSPISGPLPAAKLSRSTRSR